MKEIYREEAWSLESIPRRNKIIGILGGMGPAATSDFYRRIIEVTSARRDQDHLHVLINSCPQIPDRTTFFLGQGDSPVPILRSLARNLESMGAELLVMPCNSANIFVEQVAAAVQIPFLNWIQETAFSLLTHLPDVKRVGLLATSGTIASCAYQTAFARYGVDILLPNHCIQAQVMMLIYGDTGVKAGNTHRGMAEQLLKLADEVFGQVGVDAVIVACTELSLLLANYHLAYSLPFFDASQLMAERTVVLAGGQIREKHR